MKLLVVNPNSTVSMTEKIATAARASAHPDTEIVAATSLGGPPCIQGYLDGAICVPPLLEEAGRHRDVDAIIVGCFDDTGVDALRCAFSVPVMGIGEAAYHMAGIVAAKFSVVTTLSRSVPGLEANLERYGLARKCARVRATDIPVLKLEEGDPATIDRIRAEISLAIREDGAEAIVLGCAGMADLMARLSDEFGLPVIDGVACAVGLAEGLVRAGLATSGAGAYSCA